MQQLEEIKKELKEILSSKRYEHSIGVMEKAKELAEIYQVNTKKAMLAGLTHDIAKEMEDKKIIAYANQNSINIDSVESKSIYLLHGPVGADICKNKYGFSEDVIQAIRLHTTGDEGMTLLDKIIFLADKIEKNRIYPEVEEIRKISLQNLDEALLIFINHNIERMIRKEGVIHPKTILFRNELILKKNTP